MTRLASVSLAGICALALAGCEDLQTKLAKCEQEALRAFPQGTKEASANIRRDARLCMVAAGYKTRAACEDTGSLIPECYY